MFRHYGFLTVLVCILYTIQGWHINGDRKTYQLSNEAYEDQYGNDDFIESSKTQINDEEIQKQLTNLPKNDELFEGDIVMDNRLRDAVLGISKKSVMKEKRIKWPNGVLVYDVDPKFFKKGKELLSEAIKEFEARTCIKFKKRTNEEDYVYYTSETDVCSSNIGRIGGKQVIHIGKDCFVLGTVEHETMHALGFIHEHSRPDRDDYLDVKWENIKREEWPNFNKYTFADVNNEDVKYNFASVMHYRNDAFTKNGKDTLIAKDEESLHFGQRIKFSVGDIQGINRFYDCKEKLERPNIKGLFKDYSGSKDAKMQEVKRRLKTVIKNINRFRDRFYDVRQQRDF